MAQCVRRTVEVPISDRDLLLLLTSRLSSMLSPTSGKQRTFAYALGNLIGITDEDAVRIANDRAVEESKPTISLEKFREWLPKTISAFAAEVMSDTAKYQ